jgi:holo-[acyl-carrier protein] synthase
VIVGFGLDVVEVARIARQLEARSAERFLARIFTPGERTFCEGFRDRANRYAARFAAKEAASKALGVPAGISFLDVEVIREGGAPRLAFSGVAGEAARALRVDRAHLTLTHDGGVAVAAVILEGTG